jgi:hypothetical protein
VARTPFRTPCDKGDGSGAGGATEANELVTGESPLETGVAFRPTLATAGAAEGVDADVTASSTPPAATAAPMAPKTTHFACPRATPLRTTAAVAVLVTVLAPTAMPSAASVRRRPAVLGGDSSMAARSSRRSLTVAPLSTSRRDSSLPGSNRRGSLAISATFPKELSRSSEPGRCRP